MNLEVKKFKIQIEKFDFKSELGFFFLEEALFNANTENEFIQYEFKNDFNKVIQFTYYPCHHSIISNEIITILICPDRGSITLSNYLAYNQLNKILSYEDILCYRFKVDCENLEESIQFQLQEISKLLHGELKKYLLTDEWIYIPINSPRDDF